MKGKVYSINISSKKGGKKYPVQQATINAFGIVGDGHSGNWHRQISLLSYEEIERFNKTISENNKLGKNNKNKNFVKPGDFGENITTIGINLQNLKLKDRLKITEKCNTDKIENLDYVGNLGKIDNVGDKGSFGDVGNVSNLNNKDNVDIISKDISKDKGKDIGKDKVKDKGKDKEGVAEYVILEVTQLGKECKKPCSIYYRVGSCIMPKFGIFCKVISGGIIKKDFEITLI